MYLLLYIPIYVITYYLNRAIIKTFCKTEWDWADVKHNIYISGLLVISTIMIVGALVSTICNNKIHSHIERYSLKNPKPPKWL